MRSNLTRHVFRRLLQEEPVQRAHHIRRLSMPYRPAARGCNAAPRVQKRTLFGAGKPKRAMASIGMEPGMAKMLDLDKRIQLVVRHPPAKELAQAFNAFIAHKRWSGMPLEDLHAFQLLQTFEDLEVRASENERGDPWLDWNNCYEALAVLAGTDAKFTDVHQKLGRALYKAIQDRRQNGTAPSLKQEMRDLGFFVSQSELELFNSLLCRTGSSIEARTALIEYAKATRSRLHTSWPHILQGFVIENNEGELVRTVEMMRSQSIQLSATCHQILTLFYARRDDVERTKEWFQSNIFAPDSEEKDGREDKKKSGKWVVALSREQVFRRLLEFSLRNEQLEWAKTILTASSSGDPEKAVWDVIFQAAAATGRGVDEIDRMMGVMARRNQENGNESAQPDINTINGLIEFAISRKDAYTAERYVNLGEKWGLTPNAKNYILQIEYRLDAGDYDGARAAYAKLRNCKVDKLNEDYPIMNKMVQVLSAVPSTPNGVIMSLVDDLSERKVAYHAATVSALTMYHLKRDEYFEVVDLLTTYAYLFSTAQRTEILNLMVAFALDPAIDTGRVWDTYMIFHQVFDPEAKRTLRTQFMSLFFARQRPDLATHVFTTMTQHTSPAMQPDLATYVAAFEGVAATRDNDALEIVHNLLKLDTNVDPCTQLYTALMLAHIYCDKPHRALEYWEEISLSREGPSYATLHAMFRACEVAASHADRAEQVWQRLRKLDVDIGSELVASYVGALAGNALFDKVKAFLLGLEDDVGIPVDEFIIGSLINATLGASKQQDIEAWIGDHFPGIWASLEAKGIEETEIGARNCVGIDRTIKA